MLAVVARWLSPLGQDLVVSADDRNKAFLNVGYVAGGHELTPWLVDAFYARGVHASTFV